MYEYEEYYEPTVFDYAFTEFKEKIKNGLNAEVKEKIEKLEAENKRMKAIVDNYDDLVREAKNTKKEYKWNEKIERERIEREVKGLPINELLNPLKKTFWSVTVDKYIKQPKCNKCDENRKIYFKSPQGNEFWEYCKCSNDICHYAIKEELIIEIIASKSDKEIRYYFENISTNYYEADYILKSDELIYKGQPFDEVNRYACFFESKEKAQEYCDWLNAKAKNEEKNG